MIEKIRFFLLISAILLILPVSPCVGEGIKNVTFADSVLVKQAELELQGVAVLRWAMLFNVYAGAFYLPKGHSAHFWTEDVPKRLELSYLRDFEAADFVDSSDKLLRRNLSETEYQSLAGRLKVFYSLFQDIRSGDHYSLNYSPQFGTELRLNDMPLGSVPGSDFAVAYFGLWLGEKPIDKKFRDRLLGD